LFPGVTVSGIEKRDALRWIGDLEGGPRGVYGGAVGWLDSRGGADLAIAIRSVFQYGGEIQLNAGAGIVAESVPEREYVELVNKLRTMLEYVSATVRQTEEV
jgi:salicylate synthetase